MIKHLLSLILTLGIASVATAQRPIGTWQSYLNATSLTDIADAGDRIYCGSAHSMFYLLKSDHSIHPLNKDNGFNDVSVRKLIYHAGQKALVIAYENSNIDLLVNGIDLYNLPDIKNSQVTGSKLINDMIVIGDYVYIASDIGISVLDLNKKEIKETYIIGSNGGAISIHSISTDGSYLYAATAEGLKSISLTNSNPLDYSRWRQYGAVDGLPVVGGIDFVASRGHTIYTVNGLDIYRSMNGGAFQLLRQDSIVSTDTPSHYTSFRLSGDTIYGTMFLKIGPYLWGKLVLISPNDTTLDRQLPNMGRPVAVLSASNSLWIADQWNGLLQYLPGNSTPTMHHPAGIPTNAVFRMKMAGNTLYYAPGGVGGNYDGFEFNSVGPTIYQNGQWRNFPTGSNPALENALDIIDVAVDTPNHKAYFISPWTGVIEYHTDDGSFIHYTNTNSTLQYKEDKIRASAADVDANGNLWVFNGYSDQKLKLRAADDSTWHQFFISSDLIMARALIADHNGYIWMGGQGGRLVVYNPGSDIHTAADDQIIYLSTGAGSGGLPNANIWCIAEDKNGDIWVGTDVGIGVYFCASSVFGTNGCDADRIKVSQDGFIGYLFSTEVVKAIAVDGANRKWVGTQNGVWLISEDGKTQLLHFTSENSSLPSNGIRTITVNQITGEVFIGTENGMVSYQGDAILGSDKAGEAIVYPNPVRTSYTGPIAIKGLVDQAYVKITDVSGTLVYQGKANGGQMIWNGNGYNGTRVSSGVYIVYAATASGSEHSVAKIHFMH